MTGRASPKPVLAAGKGRAEEVAETGEQERFARQVMDRVPGRNSISLLTVSSCSRHRSSHGRGATLRKPSPQRSAGR